MNTRLILFSLVSAIIVSLYPVEVSAAKPLWVQNGTNSLNSKRLNDTYHFEIIEDIFSDRPEFIFDRFSPIKKKLAEQYGVDTEKITVDSIPGVNGALTTYSFTFPTPGTDANTVVYAQLVDEYRDFENNFSGTWDYEFYQLFAISDPDITPQFDDFEVTTHYNQAPMAMSLVPGLGQIYKGQKAKGFTIMGTEAVLIGALVYFSWEADKYGQNAKDDPGAAASWDSKASTYRTLRNVTAVLGAAVYLYNILDAALAKGAPHVVIKRKNDTAANLSFHPVVTQEGAGIGLSFTF